MDYRRFLARSEELVLPYFGGARVDTGSRRLRVEGAPRPGYVRFRVEGRKAIALGQAERPDLSGLAPRSGHFVAGYVALADGTFTRIELLPDDEPLALSPVRCRVWHDGACLFEEVSFEAEAEEAARACLEQERALGDTKGVGASLRAAFAAALAMRVARSTGVTLSPSEVRGSIQAIAERGRPAGEQLCHVVEARRAESRRALEERARGERAATLARVSLARRGREREATEEDAEERASRALSVASGQLLSSRRLDGGLLEVRFQLYGERFITVVEALSLHVVDAGVCLDGSDEEVTLESLPSVIREAIDTGQLVITRR